MALVIDAFLAFSFGRTTPVIFNFIALSNNFSISFTLSFIDVKVPLRVIGSKIEEQLKKITDFFSIDSKQYLLIIGDNDNFRVKGRDNVSKILGEDDIEGDSYILNYDDIESLISNLLIINSLMLRFKEIYIFGKLALHFLQFVRKDYTLFDNS